MHFVKISILCGISALTMAIPLGDPVLRRFQCNSGKEVQVCANGTCDNRFCISLMLAKRVNGPGDADAPDCDPGTIATTHCANDGACTPYDCTQNTLFG